MRKSWALWCLLIVAGSTEFACGDDGTLLYVIGKTEIPSLTGGLVPIESSFAAPFSNASGHCVSVAHNVSQLPEIVVAGPADDLVVIAQVGRPVAGQDCEFVWQTVAPSGTAWLTPSGIVLFAGSYSRPDGGVTSGVFSWTPGSDDIRAVVPVGQVVEVSGGESLVVTSGHGVHSPTRLLPSDSGIIIEVSLRDAVGGIHFGFMAVSVPAAPTSLCRGDSTLDGVIDFEDLNRVLGNFGHSALADVCEGDVTADGRVDFDDLNLVLGNFGSPC